MAKQSNILSTEEARLVLLESQGLLNSGFGKGKNAALTAIQHLGYVQIDTLSVVARAHHHTLWTRLPDYKENYLNELLAEDKTIFEYWSHAASYLPMNGYRFTLPRKKAYAEGKSHWFNQDKKMNKYVLDKIKVEGALQSKDFEHKRDGGANWYDWKPAKQALEQLFMEGKLMVAKRRGFQKVYDLAERVLPEGIDSSYPSEKEYAEYLINNSIRSYGIVTENEMTYLRSGLKSPLNKALKRLLKEGEVIEVKLEDVKDMAFYTASDKLQSIEKIKSRNDVHLLSPFDTTVIQRKRVERFFNFDYMIECYLPEPKRKYGYFTLPVLYNTNFVGRMDPKADRASQTFYIKSMHFEKNFIPNEKFNSALVKTLNAFATFNGCDKIVIDKANGKWKKEMEKLIK